MNRTKIEWVKNPDGSPGWTWNPITGCLGPNGTPDNPQRCPYCYAYRLARGRLKKLYLSNLGDVSADPNQDFENVIPGGDPNDPFTPRDWSDRHIQPYVLKKPSKIFVCSMAELFSDFIPDDWINNVLDICWELPEHTFQILTKNPRKAAQFDFPNNVWLGVTVTSPLEWFRVCSLLCSNAKLKFISFEPLLEDAFDPPELATFSGFPYIDWVIIGAQTQPYRCPKPEWVFRIIDRARKQGIPVFLKDNLHWPERIQEFPSKLTLRRKVGTNSQTSPRILSKSGEPVPHSGPKVGSPK